MSGEIRSSLTKLKSLRNLDLSSNSFMGIPIAEFFHSLKKLQYLNLENSDLGGKIPSILGNISSLLNLGLSRNELNGTLPFNLENLSKLSTLDVSSNHLTGSLPSIIGQLSELSVLDVSFNHLYGIVSESHFSKLTKLETLRFSSSSLILKVGSNWIPPFQVQVLEMSSCHVGPPFPAWLQTQNELGFLDLSNASISGLIPNWFWDISSDITWLNFSFNQLRGPIPYPLRLSPIPYPLRLSFPESIDWSSNLFEGPLPLPNPGIKALSLSNNQFSGPIPESIDKLGENFTFLSLASNQLTGEIPPSIGELQGLKIIDLSKNNLSGSIPSSIGRCYQLNVLDLQTNNLSGVIPESLGQLLFLETLYLSNNMISGEIPLSLQNLLSLETLDLGSNKMTGYIPSWIGRDLKFLRILSLRSNAFTGEIPTTLADLKHLQVLDLAEILLDGEFPANLGYYYQGNLFVSIKGQSLEYTKTLYLLTCIDLSGNYLQGELSLGITKLVGLVVLNLSRNHISGQIPQSISELHQLASLDLSSNMLSGSIPPSCRIPFVGHLTTFEASCFADNPNLCGAPLDVECPGDNSTNAGTKEKVSSRSCNDDNKWFYLAIGLGFATNILVPSLILATKKSWSDAYFGFAEKVADRLTPWACKTRWV
ncbi:hypothetical protein MANES_07G034400v8 [Manihot esculenta]|uniref:Uncharacterized protein n=1 Tax=Manihot esculenta TaxID=3983 RepID=A0ACB7HEF9_MANES|nr:hypothetical protein MANES_07G034400v8 [Manihot esculenta]